MSLLQKFLMSQDGSGSEVSNNNTQSTSKDSWLNTLSDYYQAKGNGGLLTGLANMGNEEKNNSWASGISDILLEKYRGN